MYQGNVPNMPATTGNAHTSMIKEDFKVPEVLSQKYLNTRSLYSNKMSVLRIVPGVAEDGSILPQNANTEETPDNYQKEQAGRYLSDTFYGDVVIGSFGRKGSAVLANYAPGSEEVNDSPTPLVYFARTVCRACDKNAKGAKLMPLQDWYNWTNFKTCIIEYPKSNLLFQAFSNYINENQTADNQLYLVRVDKKTDVDTLVQALTAPMDLRKPIDCFNNSNLGPVAEANGIYMYMNPTPIVTQSGRNGYALTPSATPAGAPPTTPATQCPLTEDYIKQVWTPWNQLLRYYTRDEQFHLIADVFGADTVNYVFGEVDAYAGFIPMEIRRVGLGRYSNMGAGGASYSTPGVPMVAPIAPAMPAVPKATPTIPSAPAPVAPPVIPATPPAPAAAPATPQPVNHFMPPAVAAAMQKAREAGVQEQAAPQPPTPPAGLPGIPALGDLSSLTDQVQE